MRHVGMQVTARADYALRAVTVLATTGAHPIKSDHIAAAEDIPPAFLHNILATLTRAGILTSHRGADGGYTLGRDPTNITVADIIRAVEGPCAVDGANDAPTPTVADGRDSRDALRAVWATLRANERTVLESITVADLAAGRIPFITPVRSGFGA